MRKKLNIVFVFVVLFHFANWAQKGNYFIHNYSPSRYHASDQNRSILQDLYGRIFVANNDGVLINNGAEWEKNNLPFLCLSLCKNENEIIYVAGDADFGKLTQTTNGTFTYTSLASLITDKTIELGKFWSIVALKGHVLFCSNQVILDYDYKTIKAILPGEEGFHTFFKVENNLLVRERGIGLKILSHNNELVLVKGGEQFGDNNNPIRGIIKGQNCHYIVTPSSIYQFNFNKELPDLSRITKLNTPINKWLSDKIVYCAAKIGDRNFAFGSVNGGVIITDLEFNPVKYINTSNGLQDDGVNYIYNDNQGHIWLALAKGISLIEFNSPITSFTKNEGIIGTIEACAFFNNSSYLATDKGLLKHNAASLKFEVTNINEATWCLANINGTLLAGSKTGLYVLNGNKFDLIYESPSAIHCIYVHPKYKDLIFLGTETGYAKGTFKNNQFKIEKDFFDLNVDIRTITSDDEGINFGTTLNGIYREYENQEKIDVFDEKNGLPNLNENYLFKYNNNTLIATDNGIYQINCKGGNCLITSDPRFELLNNKYVISRAIAIKNTIWLTAKLRKDPKASEFLLCLELVGNKFQIKPTQLSRIKESDTKSFCYNDSLVYIGTNNGLYCYDLIIESSRYGLNTFINALICGKDSSNYYYNIHPKTTIKPIELKYENNSIEIKPGASDYIDKNELLFSYYLKGRDTGYCAFVNVKNIKYDYLHEGSYTFFLKSRNILGIEGQEIQVSFKVFPPWYRTIWAYSLYTLLLLSFIYIIIKLNSKRLIEQNIKLENIITDRTKEINKQKLEIEHKNQEITDSINYAKGIQDSILPSVNEIKKAWQDVFVFFQPKDIVSGDFYWFKQISSDEFLIACADCTGHGVPGGFMSMICSDKLHDATRETTEPNEILFMANNSIKETLRQQNEGKSKDGMEICLLKINTKNQTVKFSGANRHLWIIDANSRELTEIKPTKASIASFTEFEFKYELKELQLKKGDLLFLSTDGYADQFGGTKGKKYMSKNFKDFLITHSNLSITEIEIKIKTNINAWMNGHEQVDDLLVIGIKL